MELQVVLEDPIWANHSVGKPYSVKGDKRIWKLAYYPIFEDGKTKEAYAEPRALMETPIKNGTDFREMPLRFITPLD